MLTATDHASPPDFEREWRQIQAQIAAQSPLGRQIIAKRSGHYVQDDRPELVVDAIRQLLSQIREEEQKASERRKAVARSPTSTK